MPNFEWKNEPKKQIKPENENEAVPLDKEKKIIVLREPNDKIGIGEVRYVFSAQLIEIEVLTKCKESVLLQLMKEFAQEGQKTVKAIFNNEEIVVKPDGLTVERKPECAPSEEEVHLVFEGLVGEKKYEEIRKLSDEEGLYLWEIKIKEEGGSINYEYMRKMEKGKHKEGSTTNTEITSVLFDEAGDEYGGTTVAKYENGKWRLIV